MVVENLKMAFGAVILIGIMIWTLSIFWPQMGDSITDSYDATTTTQINITNLTARDLTENDCIANTLICTNETGGETIASGNYTFTASTCSIIGTDGGDYEAEENTSCSYSYQSAVSGNFTEMYSNTPENVNTIITVSLAVLVIIILIGVYGYFTKVV